MRQQEYAQAVSRAVQIAGSIEALASALHFSQTMLRAWINGSKEVPVPVFLKVVDFLMDKEFEHIRPPSDPSHQRSDAPSENR